MADTHQPPLKAKMKLQASCPHHARTDVSVGDHEVIIDEPEIRGGTDLGPSPVQVYLSSLLGCTNVITHKCAEANGVEITAMEIDAEVEVDRRGMSMVEETDLPFPAITLNISIATQADDAALEKVKSDLQKFCPVAKAMRASGTVITENWTVNRG
jgi:putative redox protein